jgi:hypothetical protein
LFSHSFNNDVEHPLLKAPFRAGTRVARWFVFKPKIPIRVIENVATFYDHLEYFTAI